DEWLAAAASVSALISLVAMLWLALGRLTGAGLAAVGRELVPMALAALVAFGAAGLLGAALGGGAADVAAAVLGLALFALGIRLVRPQAWLLALRMSEPLRGR
ncbi:MAG: hypothetical protein QOI32_966, partial [Thermoleophilaceae bacterium]|nr:hypothetical protein [Thermoleophilaceae bacterium]